jgi:hypothetical protein
MRKIRWRWAVVLSVVAAAAVSLCAWACWPGRVSFANYLRVRGGMSRERVANLLGSPGEETAYIPGFPPYVHLPGAPPGWTGVVWGDTFVRWQSGDLEVYVGFSEGRVVSKNYFLETSP